MNKIKVEQMHPEEKGIREERITLVMAGNRRHTNIDIKVKNKKYNN